MKSLNQIKLNKPRILVIGDIILDEYYCGIVNRISPESPVPIFKYKESYCRLGGAANVAANAASITKNIFIIGIIGVDESGLKICEMLSKLGINHEYSICSQERDTIVKTRLLAQNNQQMIRIDREKTADIDEDIEQQIITNISKCIQDVDIILVSDYLKGLLTDSLLTQIIVVANENNLKVIIDVKGNDYSKYKGAFLLKPNIFELSDLLGEKIVGDLCHKEAIKKLKKLSEVKSILVTRGEKGMLLLDEEDNLTQIETVARDVFDVTGAGDTVLAYLGGGIASDVPLLESAHIANMAASIQVGKVGTSTVSINEIEQEYHTIKEKFNKIVTIDKYLVLQKEFSGEVVFTNGVFDIMHIGHATYLEQASQLGEILVVGVNSDTSVKRLKGEGRPIVSEKDRMQMLSALASVDYVILFEDDTPYSLIQSIKPDVLVKGGDYKPEEVVGKDIVENNGGKLILIPFVDGYSTTNIIEKIQKISEG